MPSCSLESPLRLWPRTYHWLNPRNRNLWPQKNERNTVISLEIKIAPKFIYGLQGMLKLNIICTMLCIVYNIYYILHMLYTMFSYIYESGTRKQKHEKNMRASINQQTLRCSEITDQCKSVYITCVQFIQSVFIPIQYKWWSPWNDKICGKLR